MKTDAKSCECATWARTFEETQGGKYPPSEHHPRCTEFKAERYVTLAIDDRGPKCVCHPNEAKDMISEAEEPYIVGEVMLTREQYEGMAEFEGF